MQLMEKVKITSLSWLKAKKCKLSFWLPYVVAATPCLFGDSLTDVYHFFDSKGLVVVFLLCFCMHSLC